MGIRSRINRHIDDRFSTRTRQMVLAYRSMKHGVPLDGMTLLVDKPQGSKVLVLAPHPDDEVIGCGGTLAKHAAAGDSISCVYMTSGSTRAALRGTLSEGSQGVAIEEAKMVKPVLGIQEQVFLNASCHGWLETDEDTVRQVSEMLKDYRPDIVYLPSFMDSHRDHIRTNEILLAAARKSRANFDCYAYEVWSLVEPNIVVDVTEQMEVKLRALSLYRSGLQTVDYIHSVKGLNMFRSAVATKGNGFAEAFFFANGKTYGELFDHCRREDS